MISAHARLPRDASRTEGYEVVMDSHELKQLLDAVATGGLARPTRRSGSGSSPIADAGGFAKVDLHRRRPVRIPRGHLRPGQDGRADRGDPADADRARAGRLVTRVDPAGRRPSPAVFPEGEHNDAGPHVPDRRARRRGPKLGRVVIVTAGTSDLPVAEEAQSHGRGLELRGLAGGRRGRRRACTGCCISFRRSSNADALVVVAGMEGALPSVVGGLVDCPVIAVPTSIGYGAHFHGAGRPAGHAQ